MIVVFVMAGFRQGGAQRQCAALINQLAALEGYEVHLIYGSEDTHFHELNKDNLKLHRWNSSSIYSYSVVAEIYDFLRVIKPDVVYSWMHSADVIVGLIKLLYPINFKWVMAERDSFYPLNWRYLLRQVLALGADIIIANSLKGKSYWKKKFFFRNKPIEHIPNILIVPSARSGLPTERKLILYAGRYEVQKNVMTVFQSFQRLASRFQNYDFLMVGDGSFYEEMVKINKPKNFSVIHHQRDIYSFYEKALVFVNVSSHEGTPNTVIENMHYGNTLVLSNIPEHVGLVGSDYMFLVDDFKSPIAVESAISRAIELSSDGHFIKYSGLSKFEPGAVVSEHQNVFKGLIHESN